MNRSVIYDYLQNDVEELRSLFYKHGKGYHVKFVPHIWTKFTQIIINDWYVEDFYSITLLIQGVIIESESDGMKIHIKYKYINRFEVLVE